MASDTVSLFYSIRFSEPHAHLADIEIRIPNSEPGEPVELWMPSWTPGSYLIREYARHLQDFAVTDESSAPLTWKKTLKNTWVVEATDAPVIKISYRMYGHELSVRTNWIEDGFALIIGAATFLAVRGREDQPHRVRIERPSRWQGIWTSMETVPEDGEHPDDTGRTVVARDLDELVDSPLLLGTPAVHPFEVDEAKIELLNLGEGGLWDGKQAASDVRAIVAAYRDMYGSLPFDRYLFFNLIVEGSGGLEHKNCCVMMTSRYAFRRRKAYVNWLGLVSHEFFHVWNVKRSRPVALGPFDYEAETYTRSLWVAEGITAYYTDLVPRRAGIISEEEYLECLSQTLRKLQSTPGRRLQSLEESSFDAWIKLYRADENTANTTISYYVKGAVVAWLLDCRIRKSSLGKRTLDDLMRLLFERYSGDQGFSDAELQEAAEEIAEVSLDDFFGRYVRGREELDFEAALSLLGLRFRSSPSNGTETPPVWLGLETTRQDGRVVIKSVRADGPAREAGLAANDEILALGGYRVTPDTLTDRLQQYKPGDRLEVLVSRRDAIQIIPITVGEPAGEEWRLEQDPDASAAAVTARKAWLGL